MTTLLEIGLGNALAAALLAVVAMFGMRLCRNPRVVHGMWLLVLIKLVTPPVFWVSVPWEAEAPAFRAISGRVTVEPVPVAPLDSVALASQLRVLEQGALEPDEPRFSLGAAQLLVLVWLAGAALWFAWTAAYLLRFRRLLRYSESAPTELQERTGVLAARFGIRRVPSVVLIPGQVSPMVWTCLGGPRLLFPARLLPRLSPLQRDTLILHELAHLARRDHWVRWLEMLASGLYWWFPVVWLARRGLHAAEEECCDACVTRVLPEAGADYAFALVETVSFLSRSTASLPAAASGVGPVPQLKRRLTMILRGQPNLSVSRLGGTILVAGALLLLPWAPSLAQPAKDQQPSAQELRQQQIQVLRQLIKALEAQQVDESRADISPTNQDVRVRIVPQDKPGIVVRVDNLDQIELGGVIDKLQDPNKKTVAPNDDPKKTSGAPVSQKAKDVLRGSIPYDPIELIRNEAAKALGQLAADKDSALKEAQRLQIQIDQTRSDIRNMEAKLQILQATLDRLAKGNPGSAGTAPGDGEFEVIRLRSGSAADVAMALDQLFNGAPKGSKRQDRVVIVAEPISNALLIRGSAADLAIVRKLLEKGLDSGTDKYQKK